jgi:hypothetical protein
MPVRFLIHVDFKNVPPPDAKSAKEALKGSIDHLKGSKSIEALYGYGQGDAIAIINADTAEDAWKFALSNPMSKYLDIEVHPVTDPVTIQEHLLSAL